MEGTVTVVGIGAVLLIGLAAALLWGSYRKARKSERSVPVGYGAGEFWRPKEDEPASPLPPRTEEPPPPSVLLLPLRFRVHLPDEPAPADVKRLEGVTKALHVIPELHLDRLRGTYRLVIQRISVGERVPPGVIPVYTIFASRDGQKNGYMDFDVPGRRVLLTNLADDNSVVSLSVNGEKLAPKERRTLKIGDTIRIGDSPRTTDYTQKRYRIDLELISDRTTTEG